MSTGAALIYGSSGKKRQEKVKEIISGLDSNLLKKGHPDLLEIAVKDKTSIGIDQTRKITAFLAIKPYSSKYKVAVIFSAEKLTVQAQNSLLKTLEEPPDYAAIIMEAKTEESLLPTVISRCRRFKAGQDEKISEDTVSIQEIKNLSIPEKLNRAEKMSKKEKDEVIKILENMIEEERVIMLKTSSKINAENINLLLNVKSDLEQTNINTRLALEYLLINIRV